MTHEEQWELIDALTVRAANTYGSDMIEKIVSGMNQLRDATGRNVYGPSYDTVHVVLGLLLEAVDRGPMGSVRLDRRGLQVMCQLCFDFFDMADLNPTGEGKVEDVCRRCASLELELRVAEQLKPEHWEFR